MLAKKNRLGGAELKKIVYSIKKERTKNFLLIFDFTNSTNGSKDESCPKIAVSISKKTVKRATDRHRLKRKITNCLREKVIDRLPERLRGVLKLQSDFGQLTDYQLSAELEKLFYPFFKK